MERHYVNITGITQSQLEMAGFIVIFQDDDFQVLIHKGDLHVVYKVKPYLFVDDRCDAEFLRDLRGRDTIPLEPNGSCN